MSKYDDFSLTDQQLDMLAGLLFGLGFGIII